MAADKVLTFRDGGQLVISGERVNPIHLTDDEQQLVKDLQAAILKFERKAAQTPNEAEVREFPRVGER